MKLIERTGKKGTRYYLQTTATVDGKRRQVQVPMGKVKKDATTRANRWLATLAESGYDAAMAELDGKNPLKRGDSPTLEQMRDIYRAYLATSAKPIKERTIHSNLEALKRIMRAANAETIAEINGQTLRAKMLPAKPTEKQLRGYASTVRMAKSVFKKRALLHYENLGLKIKNPLEHAETYAPKIEPYTPLPQSVIDAVRADCETELEPCEAVIVLLALEFGLRRGEVEYCKTSWFSENGGKVYLTVQNEPDFKPKTNEKRTFPVSREIYDRIMAIRAKGKVFDSFMASVDAKGTSGRLWRRFRKINPWLRSKGLTDDRPIIQLRAECGSRIAQASGLFQAQRVLGHSSPAVTAAHYANLVDIKTVGEQEKTPLEALAEQLGITPEELKQKISAPKAARKSKA